MSASKKSAQRIGGRLLRARSRSVGLPPGSLIYIGRPTEQAAYCEIIRYGPAEHERGRMDHFRLPTSDPRLPNTWIDVNGLHDVALIQAVGHAFGLHPLLLEDVLATDQPPKFDDYGAYVFLLFKMIYYNPGEDRIYYEHAGLALGKNFVLTFQTLEGDVFGPVRKRLQNADDPLRRGGCDLLAHALLDAIVDGFYSALDCVQERIETAEMLVFDGRDHEIAAALQSLRQDTLMLRRTLRAAAEAVNELYESDSALFSEDARRYLSDLNDNAEQTLDVAETFRDMLGDLLNNYMAIVNSRTNQIMQTLTIISTIFIPLSFIVGIYGMNFEHMPELRWRYGYFAALGLCAAVAGGFLVYFRRKRWL